MVFYDALKFCIVLKEQLSSLKYFYKVIYKVTIIFILFQGYRRAVFNESTGEYKTTSATSSVKGEHCMPQRECQKTKIQRLNIILTILPINSKETDRLGKGWCVQI